MSQVVEIIQSQQTIRLNEFMDHLDCLRSQMITFMEIISGYLENCEDIQDQDVDFPNTLKSYTERLFNDFRRQIEGSCYVQDID